MTTLSRQISDFISSAAAQNQAAMPLMAFPQKAHKINRKLDKIQKEITDMRDMLTQSGAMQWHRAAENFLKETQSSVNALSLVYRRAYNAIAVQSKALDKLALESSKNITHIAISMKNHTLQKRTQDKLRLLRNLCDKNLALIKNSVRAYYWKNLIALFLSSLCAALIVSLYIEHTTPWQAHAHAKVVNAS